MGIIFLKFIFLLILLIEIKCERSSDLLEQDVIGADTYKSCGTGKICLPFHNCPNITDTDTLLSVNVHGEYYFSSRFDSTPPCVSYLATCCSIPSSDSKELGVSNDSINFIPNITTIVPITYKKGCGHRNVNGLLQFRFASTRFETEYGEFPWIVAILKHQENVTEKEFVCGGSIIHPEVVITAAHCVHKFVASNLLVRAGEWDTKTKDEPYKEQDRYINEMILHEKYSKSALFNNIALLFTNKPFIFGADVNSICLPPSNHNFNKNFCFVAGWGREQYNSVYKYLLILKKVEVQVLPNGICQNQLQNSRLGQSFKLHESFICAGGENVCRGDGGGPLSCPIPDQQERFYQSGIIAWTINCDGKYPATYASITYLRDWIDQVMSTKGFDTSHYTP